MSQMVPNQALLHVFAKAVRLRRAFRDLPGRQAAAGRLEASKDFKFHHGTIPGLKHGTGASKWLEEPQNSLK